MKNHFTKARIGLLMSAVLAVTTFSTVGCQKEETFGETPASEAALTQAKSGWNEEMVKKFQMANSRARAGLDNGPATPPPAPTDAKATKKK